MVDLTSKYKPSRIKDFAGLKLAKAMMSKLAENPWESSWLLTGAAGTGKTSMAFAVANELNAQVHHVPSSRCDKAMIEQLVYDCNFVPMFGCSEWHVVVVDEVDSITLAAQTALLSVLDGSGHFPEKSIWFFTCNQTGKLEQRFLSRCRVLEFDGKVDAAELGQMLYNVWFAEAPAHATAPLMHKLISDAKCNARAALMEIEMALLMVPEARKVA